MNFFYHIKDAEKDIEYEEKSIDSDIFDITCFDSDVIENEKNEVYFSNDESVDVFCLYENINESILNATHTVILYEKEKSELDIWNEIISHAYYDKSNINMKINDIFSLIEGSGIAEYNQLISKLYNAIFNQDDYLNNGVSLSNASLMQLIRYIPFFSYKKNIDFYLERDTGNIGVIIPMKKSRKGTINITIQDTCEIYYSFVKKKSGLVKFSGKGYLGRELDNSDAILAILKMSEW